MFKKIAILAFLSLAVLNANTDIDKTLEDKYASCEKLYDDCLTQCEDKEISFEKCSAQCETKLYNCQSEIEETIEEKQEATN